MAPDLRRDFASRAELLAYLAAEFPEAAAVSDAVPETHGGRDTRPRRTPPRVTSSTAR